MRSISLIFCDNSRFYTRFEAFDIFDVEYLFATLVHQTYQYHYRRAETISQSLKPEGEVWRCLTEVKKVYDNHWVRHKIEKHS